MYHARRRRVPSAPQLVTVEHGDRSYWMDLPGGRTPVSTRLGVCFRPRRRARHRRRAILRCARAGQPACAGASSPTSRAHPSTPRSRSGGVTSTMTRSRDDASRRWASSMWRSRRVVERQLAVSRRLRSRARRIPRSRQRGCSTSAAGRRLAAARLPESLSGQSRRPLEAPCDSSTRCWLALPEGAAS